MPDRNYIAYPHADRYGHPELGNVKAIARGRDDRLFAAPHCDRYGHVGRDDPTYKVPLEALVVYQD
jgi:hypothetical protein